VYEIRFLISDTNLLKPLSLSNTLAGTYFGIGMFELLVLALPFYVGWYCSTPPTLISTMLALGLCSNLTRALEMMVDFFLYDEVCYLIINI